MRVTRLTGVRGRVDLDAVFEELAGERNLVPLDLRRQRRIEAERVQRVLGQRDTRASHRTVDRAEAVERRSLRERRYRQRSQARDEHGESENTTHSFLPAAEVRLQRR